MAALAAHPPAAAVELGGQEAEDDEAELEQEFVLLGKARTVTVGIRYYTGRVSKGEMVALERQPANPYDCNAIRVVNIRGEQVGHIKREVAAQLAPLMDGGLLVLEGIMPSNQRNAYTLPLDLYFYGADASIAHTLQQYLPRGGLYLQAATTMEVDADDDYDYGYISYWGGAGGGYYGGTGVSGAGPSSQRAKPAAPRQALVNPHMNVTLAPEVVDRRLDQLFDQLYESGPPPAVLEPPAVITSRLYPHQQQALAWMVHRESSEQLPPFWQKETQPGQPVIYRNSLTGFEATAPPAAVRGGILADDMGLGKTLSIVSLIATSRPQAAAPPPAEEEEQQPPAKKRKKAAGNGKKAQQKAASAAAAAVPEGPRPTLIVAPLSVLSNWQMQFEQHTDGSFQVYTYHGPERETSPTFLSKQDVVLTTYSTLAADAASPHSNRRGLVAVNWLRVVLDEAHTIKNVNTQQTKAVLRLKAERRWAVTGTPVQNRVRDLLSVMMFLRLEPLQDRTWWQRCMERPLKQREERGLKRLQVLMGCIALRRTKLTKVNGQPLVSLPDKRVMQVSVELSKEDAANYATLERQSQALVQAQAAAGSLMQNLTHVLAVLMRLRQVCDSSYLAAGPLQELKALLAASSKAPAADPALLDKLAAILAANSAIAAAAASGAAGGAGGAGAEDAEECPICLSPLEAPCITSCGHVFCRPCIESVIARDKPACPLCRAAISGKQLFDPAPPAGDSEEAEEEAPPQPSDPLRHAVCSSAKVAALMANLAKQQEGYAAEMAAAVAAGQPMPPAAKSVVFSQFVGMLDIVGAALTDAGVPYVRMDGRSSAKAREAALRAFADPALGSPRVFLSSLKCGGVGMNLVAANEVHLMEPWWNPSVEDQAMDRVHRLGQIRPVTVYRYMATNTIEDVMMKLQAEKAALAKLAFATDTAQELQQGGARAGSSTGGGRGGGRGGRGGAVLGVQDVMRLLRLPEVV